jgi:hypothetical protein
VTSAQVGSKSRRSSRAPSRARLGPWEAALGAVLLIAFVYLLLKGNGTTFYYDEWNFVLDRRQWNFHAFLEPHNEHFSLVPVATYKVLFELVGLQEYGVYRSVLLVLHLVIAMLLFVFVRERVGAPLALASAVLMLFLGAGYLDILWPFQIGLAGSLATGLGALLALERGSRLGDIVAGVLVMLSLASSSLGIPVAIGAFIYVVWSRPLEPARVWVVVLPLLAYGVWYLAYGESALRRDNLTAAPGYFANEVAAATGGLTGLSGDWGRILAVGFALVVLRRLVAPVRISPSAAMVLGVAVSFWGLTALARAHLGEFASPRYVYPGALFVLLIAAEVLRDVRLGRRAIALTFVLVAAAALSGAGAVHDGGVQLRGAANMLRAQLAAVEIAGEALPSDFLPDGGTPQITVGRYFDAVRDLGSSPALSEEELAAASPAARAAADGVLVRGLGVMLKPGDAPRTGARPQVTSLTGATLRAQGSCVLLAGDDVRADLQVPAGALLVKSRGEGPLAINVRRYADTFPPNPPWRAEPGQASILRLPAGNSNRPWHVEVAGPGDVAACGAAHA